MHSVVITDTSCLILFQKIGEIEILKKVYDNIITTSDVAKEFRDELPSWIEIINVQNKIYQEFLETQVDKGEASVLALASEIANPLLLIDDLKARKLAKRLDLRYTGTLGVINRAKKVGVISKVKPILDKLLSTNFRIGASIVNELLRINKENQTYE